MKVKAIAPGFHKGRRRVDDEFEVTDGSKASWFVPVGDTAVEPAGKHPTKRKDAQQPGAGLV